MDIFKVGDAMGERGWNLNFLQSPNRYSSSPLLFNDVLMLVFYQNIFVLA
jgi:hypothetical protein